MSRPHQMAASLVRDLTAEPWRFDYFTVLRHLERIHGNQPRIGDSATLREEFVLLGQDPFMEFPASNLARAEHAEDKPLRLFVKYMGMLGPQGALPLATTEEAYHYVLANDDAFPRFLDVFNHRFIQLFFRAWANSRPIAQHDRPDQDRFFAYIGSPIGVGSEPYRNLDSIPDAAKICFAGLLGAQAKSASRLAAAICGLFEVRAEVDEFVGTRTHTRHHGIYVPGRASQRARRKRDARTRCLQRAGQDQDPHLYAHPRSICPISAQRRFVRAARGSRSLLQRSPARLGCRARHSFGRG